MNEKGEDDLPPEFFASATVAPEQILGIKRSDRVRNEDVDKDRTVIHVPSNFQ